ncbi:unnamed protein product [Adineta ricciae]|uniref:Uncharacterized protein n=1 Tax=Adineta ricciae TaxID=249248 RepID=A0A813YG17_ADIRI|nr:unnamed protein product [Adineta ricciae]CAF0883658.1 unnamed protein product [Adineta ricciae]
MFRITAVCFLVLAIQVFGLPEYIDNLDHDLSVLPEEYQSLGEQLRSKLAGDAKRDTDAYCCTNWQHVNNDEVHTKVVTTLVPQSHTITVGYQDCHGNLNPVRPTVPIPSTTKRTPGNPTRPTKAPSSLESTTGCMWTAVNKTETYMTTEYTVVTYLVPNSHTFCAPEDYKCCSGYVLLNNNCIHGSTIPDLEFLMQLGLIGIGKK